MEKVLLSIKPEYAERIFAGEKKYEYRRMIFKNKNVRKIIVYVSSPIQKVIGEFEIESIIHDDIENLWKKTKNYGGVTENHFYEYFGNKCKGYAIKIKSFIKYQVPLDLEESFNATPPQSFIYL